MNALREHAIVVVEDSEEDFAAFRRALRKNKVETSIVRFTDGETFLGALRDESQARPPTLVILDLNLPALNGIEILRELREDAQFRSIPVVVLTTSANPNDVQRCYDLGVGGYFLKEGDFEEFCGKIGSLADYWLRAVHLP